MDLKVSCSKELEDSGTRWVSGSNSPECDGCPVSSVHIEESVSAVCQSVRRGRRRGEAVSKAAAPTATGHFNIGFRKVNSEYLP